MENLSERRRAELEFVSAAYEEEEAWTDEDEQQAPRVHRRLRATVNDDSSHQVAVASLVLQLYMPIMYPLTASLGITGTVEEDLTDGRLLKAAYDALPDLLQSCRDTADSMVGEEAVLAVLSQAEEWLIDKWPRFVSDANVTTNSTVEPRDQSTPAEITLGRRLIYSHHIISKTKRADMRNLASELNLLGYVKIGWPGLILVEGREEDCRDFYDTIRRWPWKYLIIRGEMQEKCRNEQDFQSQRRFSDFLEVDDMSVVANHCREVGLEALFRTSMKIYDNGNESIDDVENDAAPEPPYGSLVHVDHMNDGKSYRKWLRKASRDLGVPFLLIRQSDCAKKPKILVGLIGTRDNVSAVLKGWRTSRVDVNSKGKPCLERMMTVLVEGPLEKNPSCRIDSDELSSEALLQTTKKQLLEVVERLGGSSWLEAAERLFKE